MSTLSSTDIANLGLARIGADRISNIDTDTSVTAQHCRLIYEPDRDALLRAYWWPFAADRASLALSATTPPFEWSYKYALPNEFLFLRSIWDGYSDCGMSTDSYAIEGAFILSNTSPCYIRYTKKITDPTKFDDLFVQCLKTRLALDLLYPLCKNSAIGAADRLQMELDGLLIKAKLMSLAEQNLVGRDERRTWVDARQSYYGNDPAHLGS